MSSLITIVLSHHTLNFRYTLLNRKFKLPLREKFNPRGQIILKAIYS